MMYNYRIHGVSHVVKAFIGNLEYLFFKPHYKPGTLYILNLHGTPKKFTSNFERQVQFFKKKFQFLSPEQALSFLRGNDIQIIDKPLMLITFDDNMANNAYAIEILDKYNIQALHFVVTDFLNAPRSSQAGFYKTKIRPEINEFIDGREEDLTSYTWDQMRQWYNSGHRFGVHTKSHTMVKDYLNSAELESEIVSCKYEIAERLNINADAIPFFCSINNTLLTVGKRELKYIRANYEFHFTTLPGRNTPATNKMGILRFNIESHWLMGAVKYTIGRWNMNRWRTRLNDYQDLLAQP